jgi:hypothetical protein
MRKRELEEEEVEVELEKRLRRFWAIFLEKGCQHWQNHDTSSPTSSHLCPSPRALATA